MLKNNKGITLIALVITILLVVIIGTVATYSGISTVNTVKFNNAKAQFQAMQDYANSWYEETDRNPEVLEYGEDISEKADAEKLEKMQSDLSVTNFKDEGFKYFSSDYITNTFDIEGISYDFLIKVSDATVFLFGGITYEGDTYYTAEDFGLNFIENENSAETILFETKIEEENIVVYNIQFPNNVEISKYRVQYQNNGERYWNTLTSDKKQEYEYKDVHENTVKDKNAWKILIPTINEEFFSNSQSIEGEDRELALLNIKIRIIATDMASEEKTHTIVKRKETTVEKLELSNTDIIMPVGGTRTISATPTLKEELVYYAKINGNYYKIEKNAEGKYVIQENKTEIKDGDFELKADVDKKNVTININQDIKEITITGTEIDDNPRTMTVTYGAKNTDCSIRVLSHLSYIDELLKNEEEITENIKNILSEYEIIPQTETSVTDITLSYPSIMAKNDSGTIKVTPTYVNGETVYYVKFNDNEYYRIIDDNNSVKVDRTELESITGEKSLTGSSNNEIVRIVEVNQTTLDISVTSQSSIGTSTITVSYGGITKTCNIEVKMVPKESSGANSAITFSTNYGTIEVIWLDTSNNVISEPNEPILSSNGEYMTPVTWTFNSSSSTWSEDSTAQATWYNYTSNGTDRNDNTSSMWANAKTANGSYFVWIPRYAYRITYYDSQTSTTPTGYYDGFGMWKASDASLKYKLDEGIEYVEHNGNRYIVHPAFCDGTDNNYANGEWDSNLSGFWMAKYEMSGNTYSALTSVPLVSRAGYLSIGEQYLLGRQATYGYTGVSETLSSNKINYTYISYMNSHMIKNSEWGAVAYLAHSQYGRNGNEININNHNSYKTGYSGASPTSSSSTYASTYKYNTATGAKASTTGNIYGVYDMNGGTNEYCAGFNALATIDTSSGMIDRTNNLYGELMVQEAKDSSGNYTSNKYITAYYNGTTSSSGSEINYEVGKIGDGTKEVYIMNDDTRWFNDDDSTLTTSSAFFTRGGYYIYASTAGIFSSNTSSGLDNSSNAFRTVLCP